MKQIITQHGWGLDQSFWDIYKVEFEKNNWYWQDNERGYFSKKINQSKWIKYTYKNGIRMILCHSFGFNLIQKSLLKEASHIVLINSFNNFFPLNDKKNLILRSLKRMENKINNFETEDMLKEFLKRSFRPNIININLQNIFYKNLKNVNNELLLSDLKQLYIYKNFSGLFNKNCKIIFIKSENDHILEEESCNNFYKLLCKITYIKPTLIELTKQGHCLSNFNLYENIISNLNY